MRFVFFGIFISLIHANVFSIVSILRVVLGSSKNDVIVVGGVVFTAFRSGSTKASSNRIIEVIHNRKSLSDCKAA